MFNKAPQMRVFIYFLSTCVALLLLLASSAEFVATYVRDEVEFSKYDCDERMEQLNERLEQLKTKRFEDIFNFQRDVAIEIEVLRSELKTVERQCKKRARLLNAWLNQASRIRQLIDFGKLNITTIYR
jgi:hypothetical protein